MGMAETVRLDSLFSAVTKLGTAADPRRSYDFVDRPVLTPEQCDVLFNNYDLAYLICSIVSEEALAEPWQFSSENKDLVERITDRQEELGLLPLVLDADVMARCHGDCFLYVAVEDGSLNEAQPLKLESVKAIRFVRKVERSKLQVKQWYRDVAAPKFGEPEIYTVSSSSAQDAVQQDIHETRLIPFWGARTSDQKRRANNGWHLSVLQRVYDTLVDLGIAWSSATLLLSQGTQGIYKVKGLANLLAAPTAEGRQMLSTRVEMVDYVRSALKSLIMDADSEDFRYEVANLTALPELLDRFANRLSAAADGIPVTKLFGISPAGLNATGENDAKNWHSILARWRRDHLNPAVLRIRDLLLAEAKALNTDVNVVWLPLSRPSALEEAQRRSAIATADLSYVDRGVLPVEVVARARFVQENGFDQEIHMDEADIPEPPEPVDMTEPADPNAEPETDPAEVTDDPAETK